MTGFAVLCALVFLYVADALYRSVVAQAKPQFPLSLQEERKASYVLGAFIWEKTFPPRLRRKYLLSIGFGAMAAFCVTLVAYNTGHPLWAAFFCCLLLFTTSNGLMRWARYRDRL